MVKTVNYAKWDPGRLQFGWQGEGLVFTSALGGGVGAFMCGVMNYLLPGQDFEYGKWSGRGAALGLAAAVFWITVDSLFY